MQDRLDQLDYYTLLRVAEDATIGEIKAAFRKFARSYHPDRFAGGSKEKMERANAIYRRGSEAYQVLTDPAARRAYDKELRAGKLRLSAEKRDRPISIAPKAAPKTAINSPQALAFYRRAAQAARARDWVTAWKAMRAALDIEPNNRLIETRLQQIEARLRALR